MSEIVGLIREFPFGAFIIILSFLWACERTITSFIGRNRPIMNCDCDCCHVDEDDVGEEVETEVED